MFADKPAPKPTEPSEETLNRIIAEQMQCLPANWAAREARQGRGETRRERDVKRLRKPNRRKNTSGGRG